MQSTHLADLNALVAAIQKLSDDLAKNGPGSPPELLFRGQGDSRWSLTTTLERAGCEDMSFDEYYRLAVTRVRPIVEAFTGVVWEVPDYDIKLEESFRNDPELFSSLKFPSVPLYRYLVYLRHHGFPSPLFDWSSSLYVAAFFAFREENDAETRSIYAYCEMPHGSKGGAVGEPAMRPIGKYVRTHARHFRQQSDYTICAAFDANRDGWLFHRHDPVFWSRGKQDYLWKFDLPSTERTSMLKWLDNYNLNAFSLFDSQETLLETAWLRERFLKKGPPQVRLTATLPALLTSKNLAAILKKYGYETHPKGMVQPLGLELEQSSDGRTVYYDINAEAVRKAGEVPERPIRLTLDVEGAGPKWTLKSVKELAPGITSKALDRDPQFTNKHAPWPE